jgi:hypothetical protein
VNRRQRIAVIVGSVVVLGAVVFAFVPFHHRIGPFRDFDLVGYWEVSCRAPILSAFEDKPSGGLLIDLPPPKGRAPAPGVCAEPARERLAASVISVAIAGLGTFGAVRLLRRGEPTVEPPAETPAPAHS